MELATERLILREMIESDWQPLLEIERDPAVVRYLVHEPHTEDTARAYVDGIIARAREAPRLVYDFAITERGGSAASAPLVGRCGMGRNASDPRVAMLWYVVAPACAGKGYATEAAGAVLRHAFDELRLHRVYGEIDPRNLRSARVLERLGMRREAHLVQDVWIKGEWCDTQVFAMLDHEWAARMPIT